jgi:hypothetical protein
MITLTLQYLGKSYPFNVAPTTLAKLLKANHKTLQISNPTQISFYNEANQPVAENEMIKESGSYTLFHTHDAKGARRPC